jgi:hypothetical protein
VHVFGLLGGEAACCSRFSQIARSFSVFSIVRSRLRAHVTSWFLLGDLIRAFMVIARVRAGSPMLVL